MAKAYNSVNSTSLADFKQLSLLGEGAYSAVYKVLRLADREIYALKKVKLPSLSDKEKQNALNEVRLLASVRHENIIAYKEAFFDDKTRCLCIVTEYADSGDLFQLITKFQKERQHPKEADVWRYLNGMCHGLKALHDMRILHRDLKCANVFLSTLGTPGSEVRALLGDFNVSKVAKRGLCMTQTGTPYYASPEVWRDMPYDAKSDMWSLGCVLYEMVALRPPFRAEDMEGLYRKVLRGQYPRIPPVYSNDLSEVIGVLLQVNPRHRPSIDQLLQMPVMRRHAIMSEPEHRPADLLNTIKLPKNAIDLSGCLPKPQYDIELNLRAYSQESAGDIAGGTAKLMPRSMHQGARGQPLLPPPEEDGESPSKFKADSYQDSLDAYLSSPPPPSQVQAQQRMPPPPSGSQQIYQSHQAHNRGGGHLDAPPQSGLLPQINQAPHQQDPRQERDRDSLDAYLGRHRPVRQQRVPSEYADHSMEEPRLPRHASPAPSANRAAGPLYGQNPAYAAQPAYGAQQYRHQHQRGNAERRPMASYARQQYAVGSATGSSVAQSNPPRQATGGGHSALLSQGSPQRQMPQPSPPRQATGGGGGLRLPRIFTKAS